MAVLPSYRNQSIDLYRNQLTGFYMRETLALNGLNMLQAYPIMASIPLLIADFSYSNVTYCHYLFRKKISESDSVISYVSNLVY